MDCLPTNGRLRVHALLKLCALLAADGSSKMHTENVLNINEKIYCSICSLSLDVGFGINPNLVIITIYLNFWLWLCFR